MPDPREWLCSDDQAAGPGFMPESMVATLAFLRGTVGRTAMIV
jgi:hypothetical protein